MNSVHLEPIDHSNWRQALQIQSTPEQAEFVTEFEPVALQILAKSYIGEGGLKWAPFAICAGDIMVGVVAIAHSGAECQVFNLLIDRLFQGRGYGRAAMDAIVSYVRESLPDCNELTLTSHPRNTQAQKLYSSAGFVATGKERVGGPIWSFDLDN